MEKFLGKGVAGGSEAEEEKFDPEPMTGLFLTIEVWKGQRWIL